MDDSSLSTIGFIIVILTIYWTIRGLVQIFQRHNAILVVLYIIFLFPVAYIHMFILGVFGLSKKKEMTEKSMIQIMSVHFKTINQISFHNNLSLLKRFEIV